MEKQKKGYVWNSAVYCDRTYIAPDGTRYPLEHLRNQIYRYSYKYRNDDGARKKGFIDIEVRYDPHCFTHERKDGETTPSLVVDEFTDGSTVDRVFDLERYQNSEQVAQSIKFLSRKNCKESRILGKALYFKQQDKTRARYGIYVIIKIRNINGKLILFVETAHIRNNEPYKLALSDKEETYDIILGRLIKTKWSELLDD